MSDRTILKILLPLAAVVVTAVSYFFYIFDTYNIPSGSMEPTLEVGDRFLVDTTAYDDAESSPKRGDVVIYIVPHVNSTKFVGRVIGLPGDKIQMKSGRLYINGKHVSHKFIRDVNYTSYHGADIRAKEYEETLPGGKSHRLYERTDTGQFDDTRVFNVPENHYFMMGDNRDSSADSRATSGPYAKGYIPRVNILGRATRTTFSLYDCGQGKDISCTGSIPTGRFVMKIE